MRRADRLPHRRRSATNAPASTSRARRCEDAGAERRCRAAPVDRRLLERVLAHRDVCSRAPIYERYDSVVRGTTSIPCGYADAGVIVPVPGAPLGVALGVGGNPRYGKIDPGLAAEHAVVEAIRNVVAVGARPAGSDRLSELRQSRRPEQMGEFVAAVDGIARAATRARAAVRLRQREPVQSVGSGRAIPRLADRRVRRRDRRRLAHAPRRRSNAPARRCLSARHVRALTWAVRSRRRCTALRRAVAADRLRRAAQRDRGAARSASSAASCSPRTTSPTAARWWRWRRWRLPTLAHRRAIGATRSRQDAASRPARRCGFVVETRTAAAFEALCADARRSTRATRWRETSPTAAPALDATARRVDCDALHEAWSAPLRDFYDEVPRVSARVARASCFPGTNSEDETMRACCAVGLEAELVHWSATRAGSAASTPTCCRAASRTRTACAAARSPRTTR